MEINRETVETDAGPYTIIEHIDEDAGGMGSPLEEFDHEGLELYVYQRHYGGWKVVYSNLGESSVATSGPGQALEAIITDHGGYGDSYEVARRIRKLLAISGSRLSFVEGEVSLPNYYDSYQYLALVDPEFSPNPVGYAEGVMKEWAAWAGGEVYGFVVESPDGEDIASCWGFIGDDSREDMMVQAQYEVHADMEYRLREANRAGAGFVGII